MIQLDLNQFVGIIRKQLSNKGISLSASAIEWRIKNSNCVKVVEVEKTKKKKVYRSTQVCLENKTRLKLREECFVSCIETLYKEYPTFFWVVGCPLSQLKLNEPKPLFYEKKVHADTDAIQMDTYRFAAIIYDKLKEQSKYLDFNEVLQQVEDCNFLTMISFATESEIVGEDIYFENGDELDKAVDILISQIRKNPKFIFRNLGSNFVKKMEGK